MTFSVSTELQPPLEASFILLLFLRKFLFIYLKGRDRDLPSIFSPSERPQQSELGPSEDRSLELPQVCKGPSTQTNLCHVPRHMSREPIGNVAAETLPAPLWNASATRDSFTL